MARLDDTTISGTVRDLVTDGLYNRLPGFSLDPEIAAFERGEDVGMGEK